MKKVLLMCVACAGWMAVMAQLPKPLPKVPVPLFKKDTLSIVAKGAKGNGYFLNTTAIQQSIDQLHKKGVA
ncbi:hypothetical protein [Phnomibacter ginsenosidimutans]|uniref:hypothetical protein n=1 Tax=Phnomibacter ginsenosidimutans TaxID=2676868 RepID=UPI001FEBFA0E|nr:hypothetical protein [Phnomibacter ginsenosidimutans]